MGAYEAFIAAKRHSSSEHGFDPIFMPECAFDFQREIISRAVRKGRVGVFADTGLGKTLIDRQVLSLLASGAKQSPHIKALTGIGNGSLIECRKRLEQAGKIVVESAPSPHGGPPTFVWRLN